MGLLDNNTPGPPVLMLPTIEFFLQVLGAPIYKSAPDGDPDMIVEDGDITYLCWAYGKSKWGPLYKICRVSKTTYTAPDLTEKTVTNFQYPYGCTGYNFILDFVQGDYDFYYLLTHYTYAQKS